MTDFIQASKATNLDTYDHPEHKANAHLIAAAPELYEALAEARSVIDVLVKDGFLGYAEQRGAADAALARARGEL